MKLYSGKELKIPHEDFLRLRGEGKVTLGIERRIANQISLDDGLKPAKTTAAAAFRFWGFIIFVGLIYSIYLSFTAHWWWFLIGLGGVTVFATANQEANQDNLMDAAMVDREFYEKVADLGGWLYKMDQSDAEPFFTQEYRTGMAAIERLHSRT